MSEAARLAELRRRYADELTVLAPIAHRPLTEAFASVPRERFLGPAPWRIFEVAPEMRTFESPDDDPAHLYRNVLVAIDRAKSLNNGEPRYWAVLFDALAPKAGERIVHVGAGTGYYTAILAEMAGPSGQVTGIEWEPDLAARAAEALAPWPQAKALCGDGLALATGPADVVVASCGLDAVPLPWVRLLADGGRLMFPLTFTMGEWSGGGWGRNVVIRRQGDRFEVRLVGQVGIYHSMSGRTPAAEERLKAALATLRAGGPEPRSLRLAPAAPDETCWLAGDGWWLSTAAA